MKILLTGAGGFIGSVLLPLLCRRGHEVTVLCRAPAVPELRRRLAVEQISCPILEAEPAGWAQAIGGRSFAVCLHLAWVATPGIYLNSPENQMFADCTLTLAERLISNGPVHFLGAGTCIEYAPGQTLPSAESHTPSGPTSPYAAAKLTTQQGLARLAGHAGAGLTWARIFYPYGAGEHSARTASSFFRTLAAGQPLVLKTAASQKDFIEIRDVASALAHLSEAGPQGIINIGTGIPTRIRDLALLAAALSGANPALVQEAHPAATDPYGFHVADPDKLFATGWRPSVNLEVGMRRLLAEGGILS